MQAHILPTWIAHRIAVRHRLERVCTGYLLFLMVVTTKHSFAEAAHFSGLHTSQFCQMLKSHANVAISTLERLAKKQAKQFSKPRHAVKGLPWNIAMLIDSTLPPRASLHPENTKKFNHGNGFVIGHQWTHIVLLLHDMLIPLRPIPYYRKRDGLDHHRADQTEHDRVVESLHH